jgi:hypothetical protein
MSIPFALLGAAFERRGAAARKPWTNIAGCVRSSTASWASRRAPEVRQLSARIAIS